MKVWEKRFRKLPDKEIEEFTSSFNEDNFLYPYDIEGSKAHVLMLEKAGYLTSEEKERLIEGLERVKKEMEEGEFEVKGDEDVHMAVERRLKELVGDVAEKLHTARSRNDQVVLDEKLFLKDKIPEIIERIEAVQKVILEKAERYLGVVMAGFTHFRPAQPVLFSHWLMVYFWMLERDKGRFEDVLKRVDEFPGGSLALAGTSLAIDRQFMAEKLGFKKVSPNSMDAVSDRDFILEFLTAS
ncbi:MAG TPA: argininosuccinate lyase, partial [bacterium]|nr:argininosuccinate lyase [bacterium]HEX67784.1 argininosuccinate lyase [bacterium]